MAGKPKHQDLMNAIDRMVSNEQPYQKSAPSYSQQPSYPQNSSQRKGGSFSAIIGAILMLVFAWAVLNYT